MITEFAAALRTKTYSYLTNEKNEKRHKGTKKCIIKTKN